MRLIIAEKPSVAQAIAGVLGSARRTDGYIDCAGPTRVTWCFGRFLEQAKPEEYVQAAEWVRCHSRQQRAGQWPGRQRMVFGNTKHMMRARVGDLGNLNKVWMPPCRRTTRSRLQIQPS